MHNWVGLTGQEAYTGLVMKALRAFAVFGLASAAAASPAFAEVRISIDNGRVSLTAKDATVRQILTEWSRVGQTRIVNVERIPGGPLTLELADMPEDQALNLLLRSVGGYVTTPRAAIVVNASRFDRIIVMPTAAVPRPAMAASATPVFNAPTQQIQPVEDDSEDERQAPNATVPTPNPRGPVFNSFPPPQVINPQQGIPTANPGGFPQGGIPQATAPVGPGRAPGTVSAPGMIAPVPVQQPGQPQQGPAGQQPPRRPGGGR